MPQGTVQSLEVSHPAGQEGQPGQAAPLLVAQTTPEHLRSLAEGLIRGDARLGGGGAGFESHRAGGNVTSSPGSLAGDPLSVSGVTLSLASVGQLTVKRFKYTFSISPSHPAAGVRPEAVTGDGATAGLPNKGGASRASGTSGRQCVPSGTLPLMSWVPLVWQAATGDVVVLGGAGGLWKCQRMGATGDTGVLGAPGVTQTLLPWFHPCPWCPWSYR